MEKNIQVGAFYAFKSTIDDTRPYYTIFVGEYYVLLYLPGAPYLKYISKERFDSYLVPYNKNFVIDDDFWLGVLDALENSMDRGTELRSLIEEFKNSKQEDPIPAHIRFQHKLGKIK